MANSKGTTKKSAPGKQPAKQAPPVPDKGAWREVVGILLIVIGLVLTYFVLLDRLSDAGRAVNSVLSGLAGVLRYVVPLLIVWAGVLVVFSGRGNQIPPWRVALAVLFVLFACACVHSFVYEDILRNMGLSSFVNFIARSYAFQKGGAGVLGAILCWPLRYWMGFNTVVMLMIMVGLIVCALVLLRKFSLREFGEKVQGRYEEIREQRASERAEQQKMENLPRTKSRGKDLDELEMWPDTKKPEPAPVRPEPKKPILEEVTVPKFAPSEPVVSKRSPPKRQVTPFVAEELEAGDDVPDFLLKGKKKVKAERAQVAEPKLRFGKAEEDEPEEEQGDERLVSGGMQFPPEGLSQWPEMSIGDALYDDEELSPDDDAPPFDVPASAKPAFKAPGMDLPMAKPARTAAAMPVAKPAEKQDGAAADEEPYNYPPIDLLAASTPSKVKNQEQKDEQKARTLIDTLQSFGIAARLIGIAHGPTVTRFELAPAAGVKVSRITALADDIALNLAALSVRIEAPIPGKAAVGVEVPNDVIEVVPLRDVLESGEARRHPSRLATALGRDNAGRYIIADLAKMPHVLIAGQTGAGKSVCINCLICSILYRATPEEVKLIMIDPKVVELSAYNGIPHLLVPVVTDPKKAASALEWAVQEMTVRYKKFAELGVRDMKGYNQHRPPEEPPMPQIVIIIDELADLMMVTPGEVEDAICRLAQLARAAGIHLVIATQRPSVNVITGVIKANIPSRIAFTVASQVDSRTILDVGGAEKLLGRGDMLFAPSGSNKPTRVQGAWVSDEEVHDVVEYIKNLHETSYNEDIMDHIENAERSDAEREEISNEYDELLPQAIEVAIESGQTSISMLQRRLRVGYARAGRLVDEMTIRGIISEAEGAKPRNVLISREQYRMMFDD